MDRFDVTILGCGSATPTLRHHPSAQAVNFRGRVMLIDCGEGTQLQLRRYSIPFSRITDIFISHLHGDHCLGLPGLLSTLDLQEARQPITVHIPAHGLDIFTRMLKFFCPGCKSITLKAIPEGTNTILSTKTLTVTAFPLYHRVPAFGFIFREEPRERRLLGGLADQLGIPPSLRKGIKAGASWRRPSDGRVFDNRELTASPPLPLSFAYCSDTLPDPRVAQSVSGVDLLYHEATYLSDLETQASLRGHSTAAEAGEIARLAGAGALVIGHYSKRYTDSVPLVAEAAGVFPGPVIAADEGMVIQVSDYRRREEDNLVVTPVSEADIPAIMEIFNLARGRMRAGGNMTQWTGGYPSEEVARADMEASRSFAVRDASTGMVEGVFTILEGEEPTYARIDGRWPDNRPYVTIHRVAGRREGLRLADRCLAIVRNRYPDVAVRIDTHADNRPMLGWIRSRGFEYCGIIYMADGSPRLAFQSGPLQEQT